MTNQEIRNAYLRSLLAHELLGHRKVYWRTVNAGQEYEIGTYYYVKHVCRCAFGRVDLHLRLYPEAVMAGDPTPLEKYPASFAGH